MNKIDSIIEVYRQEGHDISREEAESILEAMEFAHEVWTSKE